MASSLLLLLDDIATVLDDVSILTKVAAKKTAGVLGDDLALNAQQVSGVKAERELPVVWAVCKGSFINKAILVPAALLIGTWLPWLVTPLLMIGGAFLCFEGCEKLAHKFLHKEEHDADISRHEQALADPAVDLVAVEKGKIKGAVRTDFILSAEIIAITLGTVQGQPFTTQLSVLVGIALIMTIGVYGLVAGIVKLDDAGLYLSRREGGASQALGRGILVAAPWLMKGLSIAGTAAMFLVGGGILVHGVPALGHAVEHWAVDAGALVGGLGSMGVNAGVGIVAGAIVLGVVELAKKAFGRKAVGERA
jgi:predicted DNA repair protein MutK